MLDLGSTTAREALHRETALSLWLRQKGQHNKGVLRALYENVDIHPGTKATQAETSRPLVAVVDDETVIAVTLSELLNRHGYRSVWFTLPMEALQFVRRVRIDLLLTDIQMPELDGGELSLRVAGICPNCQILLLSANSHLLEKLSAERALRQNFFFAQKPIQVDHLLELVDHLIPSGVVTRTHSKNAQPTDLRGAAQEEKRH